MIPNLNFRRVNVINGLFTLFEDNKERIYQTILDAVESDQNVDKKSLASLN